MPREITNYQLGELHAALSLLTRDSRRVSASPIVGDLTYTPLALRVARALGELRTAKHAMDTAIQGRLAKYMEDNGLPEGVQLPPGLLDMLIQPVLAETQEVPDLKPLTGEILSKAGVKLDAGMILALDFMLVDYAEEPVTRTETVAE